MALSHTQNTRLLCVFAHPDDEVFCAGGTIARYAAEGAEVMVVSATRGDAGQIRDASIATRRTLGKVREQELQESCRRLGAHHAICLEYGDGTLKDVDSNVLAERIVKIIREYCPDVVVTFGSDGAYGHPDHIAIGAATTLACKLSGDPSQFPLQVEEGLDAYTPCRLYHSYFPRNRILMLDRLAHWLVEGGSVGNNTWNTGDPTDFVRALLLFAEETTMLGYTNDRIDVQWYPTGFYIIEQGEVAKDLYLILSGRAEAVHEAADGALTLLNEMGPGSFFGERALATGNRRAAHVIAKENVTCLVLSTVEAVPYVGRGSDASLLGGADRIPIEDSLQGLVDHGSITACIDVTPYLDKKLLAMAAHRTQYPISPDMFPAPMLAEMMGREYFVRVLPRPEVEHTLFPDHPESR